MGPCSNPLGAPIALIAVVATTAAAEPASSTRAEAMAGDEVWGEARVRGVATSQIVVDDHQQLLDSGSWSMSRVVAGLRHRVTPSVTTEIELEAFSGYLVGGATSLGTTATDHPFPVSREGQGTLLRVLPRKLNVAWTTGVGRVTAGAQTFGWGIGMLANDGTGQDAFGDGWTGNVVARLAFATRPLERTGAPALVRSLAVFAAGDFVLRDDNASVYDGDRAFAGVLGALASHGRHALGAFASARAQRDREDAGLPPDLRARTTAYVIDAFGRTGLALTSTDELSIEVEGAAILGSSTRPLSDATFGGAATLRQFGGVGRVRWRHAGIGADVEAGYASGDNDPRDAVARTFTMHTDHNVGIVLFEQVLPILSARAVDRISDRSLVGAPMAGVRFAINPGAVQNAIYGNVVARIRPSAPLDLRFGYLFAVPAADVLDVYQTAMQGGFTTGYGGRVHDRGAYGHELDARATYDVALVGGHRLQVGCEAGALIPGAAFAGVERVRPTGGDARVLWLGRVIASLFW